MQTSLGVLAGILSTHFGGLEFHGNRHDLINCVELLNRYDVGTMHTDAAYVVKASMLPKDLEGRLSSNNINGNSVGGQDSERPLSYNFICIADVVIPEIYIKSAGINLIILHTDESVEHVFNIAAGLFAEHMEMMSRKRMAFLACTLHNDGLERLAKLAYKELGNPVLFKQMDFTPIACTQDVSTKSRDWELIRNPSQNNLDLALSSIILDPDTPAGFLHEPRLVVIPGHTRYYVSCVTITGVPVASICVPEVCTTFKEEDYDLIYLLNEASALEFSKEKYESLKNTQLIQNLILDLLDGKVVTEAELNSRMKDAHMVLQKYTYILSGRLGDRYLNPAARTTLSKQIYFTSGFISVPYEKSIVILAGFDQAPEPGHVRLKPLEQFLTDEGLTCGQSQVLFKLLDLRQRYLEAEAAMEIGQSLHRNRTIYCYNDYIIHHMASIYAQSGDLRALCHPVLAIIENHDKVNGTDLMRTLYMYFRYGRNLNTAARALHVHRNTMDYRIKKIKTIVDIDSLSLSERENLYTSMKIMEYINRRTYEE